MECFDRTFGEVGSVIHEREQDTVYLQVRVDMLLYLLNGLQKLCHTLSRKVLCLNGDNHAICRRKSIESNHTE